MTPEEFEGSIVKWARRQSDISALVLIGSRALNAGADALSDWDFYIISDWPGRYHHPGWVAEIAPPWCAHVERSPRGTVKVSAVFTGGLEADFVPLPSWRMKMVFWFMARPAWRRFYPEVLQHGIDITRLMVGPGYKVIWGGMDWERRLDALRVSWPVTGFTATDFEFHTSAFWRNAVWVFKKIARGESRAALRWNGVETMEHLWALLAEEARVAGQLARPEARRAEHWLDARRLRQTDIITGPDQKTLARALLEEMELFEEVSRSVAGSHGFALPDNAAVAAWLRTKLARILERP